ncbi:MAG: hypothetical protein JWR80_9930 [Bradyrhizobium sp.]|nr:hypothetical protein [Bradyrhizobium sp.]
MPAGGSTIDRLFGACIVRAPGEKTENFIFELGGGRMRKAIWLALVAGTGLLSVPSAQAQSSFMADVIGQTIGSMNSGWPSGWLSLEWKEDAAAAARFDGEAEPALKAYLTLTASKADPTPAYKRRSPGPWALDGLLNNDIHTISDPWAGKVARLERVGVTLGRAKVFGHGVWRAFDADGHLLGTYDAELIRKTKGYAVMRLRLWSPGQEAKIWSLTPYCGEPGDHEAWLEARVAAEAKKAQRRAEAAARARN